MIGSPSPTCCWNKSQAARAVSIAVAPSDPNVIYVGTGSAEPRGNVSPGRGAYRSTDAGKTWMPIGLENTGQIGRIQVHPDERPSLHCLKQVEGQLGRQVGLDLSSPGGRDTGKLVVNVRNDRVVLVTQLPTLQGRRGEVMTTLVAGE